MTSYTDRVKSCPCNFVTCSETCSEGNYLNFRAEFSRGGSTSIDNIHAGTAPVSNTGDFSDVFVIDANGNKTPWDKVSRISQEEMKELMQAAVNRVYAVLTHDGDAEFEENVLNHALTYTRRWDEPGGS